MRRPNPKTGEFSGSYLKAESESDNFSIASFKSLYWSFETGKNPAYTNGKTFL